MIRRILTEVAPQAGDHFVEIGPGLGALTRPLCQQCRRLDLVEIDRDLARQLEENIPSPHEQVQIHCTDALKLELSKLADVGKRFRLIGNLPYNITTPLLFHFIKHLEAIQDIHCMVQKEVAVRLAASPGNRDWGRLSIMVQYHCEVQDLMHVAPGAFRPAPKVDSAVVRLLPRAMPPAGVNNYKLFEETVRRAFCYRRKTLRNALSGLLDAETIAAAGIDPGARAETLDIPQFVALANAAAAATLA